MKKDELVEENTKLKLLVEQYEEQFEGEDKILKETAISMMVKGINAGLQIGFEKGVYALYGRLSGQITINEKGE